MSETVRTISQKEITTPSLFSKFLWWLSTAEEELIKNAVVDRNRYKIVGMTVLATWMFATLSWTYFFSTIVGTPIVFISLGLFMGFIILTIDRALIKGINRQGKRRLTPLIFRGLLALTIGTFMAQPAILYMFDKEIRLQTSLDNEKKRISKSDELTLLYHTKLADLSQAKKTLQADLDKSYNATSIARNNYIAEADGSGGTGKIGLKTIAMAKKAEYEKLSADYNKLLSTTQPKIDTLDAEIKAINANKTNDLRQFGNYFNDGFLTRIEALNNLLKTNTALQYRYYLLLVILMLIELMPVIVKSILPAGTYDEKVRLQEEMEIDIARSDISKQKRLQEYYNAQAVTNDEEAINVYFALTREERKNNIRLFHATPNTGNQEGSEDILGNMKKQMEHYVHQ